MPIYSYRCQDCDDRFDVYHKIKDRDLPTSEPCPKCKGTVEKLVTCTSGFLTDVSTNGGHKTPSEFKDFLKQLKNDSGKHSTIQV